MTTRSAILARLAALAMTADSAPAQDAFKNVWAFPEPRLPLQGEAVAGEPGAAAGPKLAAAWRATVAADFGGTGKTNQRGTLYYDRPGQRWRASLFGVLSIFHPGEIMVMDQLAANTSGLYNMNMTVGQPSNSVCKVTPGPYSDMFAGLLNSKRVGSGSVAGEACELWENSVTAGSVQRNVSACIAADGVPRQFNQTTNMAYSIFGIQYYTFSNISTGPQGEETFVPSDVCRDRWPMPPCQGPGTVVSLEMYRSHGSTEPPSLENRNTGDALGDMGFFCAIGGVDETKLVTQWAVEANSSWGQYAYCLFQGGKNLCLDGTGRQVGRESSVGAGQGAAAGQCSPNEEVGSWFSMPAEGMCPPGAAVGTEGCTWRARPLRTVSSACIVRERGLAASCAKEFGRAPLLKSAAIFRAAFASVDPARGGCPDVPVAEGEPAAVLV